MASKEAPKDATDKDATDDLPISAVQHEVGREHHGKSLLDAVDAIWGPVDRRRLLHAAKQRQLQLNGEPAGPSITLRTGDVIELFVDPETLARKIENSVPWLHQAAGYGVAAKPSGVPFDASRGRTGQSAIERLSASSRGGARARPVHRLDKETSGIVVVALDREHEESLTQAFLQGEAWVEYLAILRWPPVEDSGVIDLPLSHGRRSDQGLHGDAEHGHAAQTSWSVEERWGSFALVRARPLAGRSHQVRAHLASLGHPALGDAHYGEDRQIMLSQLKLGYRAKRGRPERPLLQRPAIHAERFVHRAEGVEVVAPLPQDLQVLVRQLTRLHERGAIG